MRLLPGLVLTIVCFALFGQAETVDRVVATVGTEVILQSDIMQELAPALTELRQTAADQGDFNLKAQEHFRQALEQAIEYKILLREALLAGLDITDEQVEERINEIKKRFGSPEEFNKELEKAGETISDFRNRIKKQILAISMGMKKRREFEKQAEVTEADVAAYYQEHRDQFARPERVRVRRLFVPAGASAEERAAAKAKIQDLKTQLDNGADFAELAKAFSSGPDAEKGGLIGWVARNDLVKNLEDAAFALPEKGVSDVIETEFGFVILKVEQKEAAGTPELDEVRTLIESELRTQRANDAYTKWMNELKKRSRVRVFI